jgi:hypothetical protein
MSLPNTPRIERINMGKFTYLMIRFACTGIAALIAWAFAPAVLEGTILITGFTVSGWLVSKPIATEIADYVDPVWSLTRIDRPR